MTKIKRNEQFNKLGEQAKSWIEKGNTRHVVVRSADGDKIAEFSLTVAVIAGVILLVMPWSWLLIFAAAIYGMTKKLRVEIIRDLSDEDESIQVDLDE